MAVKSVPGYRSKPRNTGMRQRRSTILVAAEGRNKTETLYLRDFAREYNQIIAFVPGNYTDPVNMVRALIKEYKKKELDVEDGDAGYCLIDSDFADTKNIQIALADRIAERYGMRILVSGPCFEIWYLCHYGASTRQYCSGGDVLSEVRKYHPDYKKNMTGMFAATRKKIPEAIKNAERLRVACKEKGLTTHTSAFMPSTEIDELARRILSNEI